MHYTGNDRDAYFVCPAEQLAPWLLGKLLCVKPKGQEKIIKVRIFETEAYGDNDSACYGCKQSGQQIVARKTSANSSLFKKAGTCCIYGGMLLISAGKTGSPENVLIRGAGYADIYCSGPVGLCEALNINKSFDGVDILSSNDIWLEDDGAQRDCCREKRKGLGKTVNSKDKELKLRFISI